MSRAYLNGVPLPGIEPVGWSFTAGTMPYMRSFEMLESHAKKAAFPHKNAVLKFTSTDLGTGVSTTVRIQKLYIVSIRSGSTPHTRRVVVADRRWLWLRKHIARSYNVRRRSGVTRLKTQGEGKGSVHQTVDDITYNEWSLTPEKKAWRPEEILADILKTLAPDDFEIITTAVAAQRLTIEGLELHDNGSYALYRALKFTPGLKCWVDKTGRVKITEKIDGSEVLMFKNAGPKMVGAGYPAMMDNSFSRPKKVHVLFTRAFELRFDFVEDEDEGSATEVPGSPDKEEPRLENVLPLPDLTLDVKSVRDKKSAYVERVRGTYVEMSDFLDACANDTGNAPPLGLPNLSQTILRKHASRSFGELAGLYGSEYTGAPSLIWRQRIAAIRKSWRIMFRIRKKWKDRIRSVRAQQAAIVDTETGTRGPSLAFMQYLRRPAYRTLAKSKQGENAGAVFQVDGWADNLENGQIAPASVRVSDEDNGVLTVKLFTDPWGESDFLLPGATSTVTTQAAGDLRALFHRLNLDSGFKMAVVLSCVQAAPNDEGRFHKVTLDKTDVQDIVPGHIGVCNGEDWTIQIKASLHVARYRWDDKRKTAIHNVFFKGQREDVKGNEEIDTLMVQPELIKNLARAAAARVYAGLVDRMEGVMGTGLNGNIEPRGYIDMVSHEVGADGSVISRLGAPPDIRAPSIEAFLPEHIRRVIERSVEL